MATSQVPVPGIDKPERNEARPILCAVSALLCENPQASGRRVP